jgi:hypothetical protein
MSAAQDNSDRLVRVEEMVKGLAIGQEKTEKKVDEMYSAFMQARGAKWAIVTLWIMVGAAVANIKSLLSAMGVKFG